MGVRGLLRLTAYAWPAQGYTKGAVMPGRFLNDLLSQPLFDMVNCVPFRKREEALPYKVPPSLRSLF